MRDNAVVSIPLPRAATEAFLPYTSFVVTLAMLFGGGGNQGWSDALVQLAALPLLAWALFKLSPSQLDRHGQWAIVLLCAILAWPLLQLIPMPPTLWSALPGRGEIAIGLPSGWNAVAVVANKPRSVSHLAGAAIVVARHCDFPCDIIARAAFAPRFNCAGVRCCFCKRGLGRAADDGRPYDKLSLVLHKYQSRSRRRIFCQRKPQCRISIFRNSVRCRMGDRSRT